MKRRSRTWTRMKSGTASKITCAPAGRACLRGQARPADAREHREPGQHGRGRDQLDGAVRCPRGCACGVRTLNKIKKEMDDRERNRCLRVGLCFPLCASNDTPLEHLHAGTTAGRTSPATSAGASSRTRRSGSATRTPWRTACGRTRTPEATPSTRSGQRVF